MKKTLAEVKAILGLGSAAYTESSAYAAASHTQAFSTITGTVSVAQGGTGQTTLAAARNAMGLGNTTGALPIVNGGTGATTAAVALTALGLTATAAELNILDGVAGVTPAEINYLANVTSDIQAQLNAKIALVGTSTMTGSVVGPAGTDYTVKRFRNIVFKTGADFTTTELANGDIGLLY